MATTAAAASSESKAGRGRSVRRNVAKKDATTSGATQSKDVYPGMGVFKVSSTTTFVYACGAHYKMHVPLEWNFRIAKKKVSCSPYY